MEPLPSGEGDSRKKALPEFWHSRRSKRYVLIQKILLPLEGELAEGLRGWFAGCVPGIRRVGGLIGQRLVGVPPQREGARTQRRRLR